MFQELGKVVPPRAEAGAAGGAVRSAQSWGWW